MDSVTVFLPQPPTCSDLRHEPFNTFSYLPMSVTWFYNSPLFSNVYDRNLVLMELNNCQLFLIIYLYHPIIQRVWLTLKAVKWTERDEDNKGLPL